MRQYIRHPSDIPIKYSLCEMVLDEGEYLKNISQGGLCFNSKVAVSPDARITIEIPISNPVFSAVGVVVWCKQVDHGFDVGVRFLDMATESALRLVEQVCYIEKYKKDALENDGRMLSGEEAAIEWIKKFAQDFPQL